MYRKLLLGACTLLLPLHAEEAPAKPSGLVAKPYIGPAATTGTTTPVRPATSSEVLVETSAAPLSPTSLRVTAEAIDTAAGAFEDPARFFQLLPGVASGNDQRNDFLVRGGNPSENLFVIDNIDVHSISHLALSDTTGGFVSMIDNAAIETMTLHTGAHDAKFDDRLSSVVEISTIPEPGARVVRHMTEVGIAGVGGLTSRPLGHDGSLFVSGREGVLRLFTNDIGLNGVPNYTNSLVRADTTLASGNKVWGLALTGIDSIRIHPDPKDSEETNPIDIRYSGWRNTTGVNWQHFYSGRSFGVVTLSNSEQAQIVSQDAQLAGGETIYNEQSHDGDTALKAEFTTQPSHRLTLSGGATEVLRRLRYDIVQPADAAANPYSALPSDATNIHRSFATDDDAAYAQAVVTLPLGVRLTAATRAHRWAFGSNFALTPKVAASIPLGGTRSFSIGIAEYAQMPASLYLLSFAGNASLHPIRARHETAAVTLLDRSRLRLTLAAYRKTYRAYPVAAAIPQLSLANVADTFGEAFLMFPMVSRGLGRAAGVELAADCRPSSRLTISANLAYARNRYSGLDGIFRPGNFDLPVAGNVAAVLRAGHRTNFSARYSGASGRPYTPDDLERSSARNRDVYDLSRVNALRSPAYGRLDFRVEKTQTLGRGDLLWHVGLDNALDRKNFYSYQWEPRLGNVSQQSQMPRFPDGGVKYTF